MNIVETIILSPIFFSFFQSFIILLNLALGLIAFLHSPKEYVNRVYLLMVLAVNVWIAGLIIFRIKETIWGTRMAFAGASLISVFFFNFSISFPLKIKLGVTNLLKYIISPAGIIFAVLSIFTPLMAEKITSFNFLQYAIKYGPLYPFFVAFFLSVIIASIILLIYQFIISKGVQHKQSLYIVTGLIIGTIPGLITNLLLPWLTNKSLYSQFGPLAVAVFIAFSFYAIAKHKLFNARIVTTEIFVIVLAAILFFEILLENQMPMLLARIFIFGSVVIFGILLIKSVLREIKAKEKIQTLAKDLETANEELKKLDKAKSEFLSIASHQLRTPLTAIKGYSSMILEGAFGKFSEGVKDATGKILESSRQLVLMIDDFLDISKIEAGKMSYEFSTFNLDDLIKKMVKGFLDNNKKARELNLKYITSSQDFRVRGDINKISQVVSNLLDNAVKYTPTGYINVHLDKNQKGDAAILTVKDTGIGISKETMAKLFQKFSRSEKSSLFNTSGSGLGLYVAKRIITDHKGRIWVESDGLGKGSSFFVELPLG